MNQVITVRVKACHSGYRTSTSTSAQNDDGMVEAERRKQLAGGGPFISWTNDKHVGTRISPLLCKEAFPSVSVGSSGRDIRECASLGNGTWWLGGTPRWGPYYYQLRIRLRRIGTLKDHQTSESWSSVANPVRNITSTEDLDWAVLFCARSTTISSAKVEFQPRTAGLCWFAIRAGFTVLSSS